MAAASEELRAAALKAFITRATANLGAQLRPSNRKVVRKIQNRYCPTFKRAVAASEELRAAALKALIVRAAANPCPQSGSCILSNFYFSRAICCSKAAAAASEQVRAAALEALLWLHLQMQE